MSDLADLSAMADYNTKLRTLEISLSPHTYDRLTMIGERLGSGSDSATISALINAMTAVTSVQQAFNMSDNYDYAIIRSPLCMGSRRYRGYIETMHETCAGAAERFASLVGLLPELQILIIRVEWTDGVVAQGPIAPERQEVAQ